MARSNLVQPENPYFGFAAGNFEALGIHGRGGYHRSNPYYTRRFSSDPAQISFQGGSGMDRLKRDPIGKERIFRNFFYTAPVHANICQSELCDHMTQKHAPLQPWLDQFGR